MAQSGRQLPLLVQLRDDATLDNFLAADTSAALLEAVREMSAGQGEAMVFIHGAQGSGKSHLLQGACHLAGDNALYLPLRELSVYPPEEVLSGVETLGLVALDDLDVVMGQQAWEHALFGLYNRAREWGCRLLIAADAAPRVLGVELADLRSRLSWGVVYQLLSADDEQKRAILQYRASRRGLNLGDDVAGFIVTRAPRDLSQLLDLLDQLDRASLARKRALSIPFVKQVLGW
ncbi:DnaA regulatory inactivator Hda [Seongchinamella sediminis]|uniref:DnaA regulatory inactivator Hda n=1 Tax=Seongchinamella sediminis TaxID=2283635 RepID=A0A3L7DYE4_9GAMM|nr:DnaA regulatory inactivator Hda [Seongchinamella sediminis]RLQ21679.1 DnaA regulatory inactivator Hda [Seongchinamella sediminis]